MLKASIMAIRRRSKVPTRPRKLSKKWKDPAAQALGRKRWKGTTKAERSEFGRRAATQGGGRPRSTDRCPCGALTRARAAKRNHRCQAIKP
jgi:hypothetical protein